LANILKSLQHHLSSLALSEGLSAAASIDMQFILSTVVVLIAAANAVEAQAVENFAVAQRVLNNAMCVQSSLL
jgi:hypothetical protein